MSKFGNTKIGAFLTKAAPGVLDLIGDTIPGGALIKTLVGSVLPESEKPEFEAALLEYETKEMEMMLNDRQDARAMQIAALEQSDNFSKRFVYYLAAFVMVTMFILMVLLYFVQIPEGNNEIVYMGFGLFLGIASTVAAFFFGSSSGSKEKDVLNALRK